MRFLQTQQNTFQAAKLLILSLPIPARIQLFHETQLIDRKKQIDTLFKMMGRDTKKSGLKRKDIPRIISESRKKT